MLKDCQYSNDRELITVLFKTGNGKASHSFERYFASETTRFVFIPHDTDSHSEFSQYMMWISEFRVLNFGGSLRFNISLANNDGNSHSIFPHPDMTESQIPESDRIIQFLFRNGTKIPVSIELDERLLVPGDGGCVVSSLGGVTSKYRKCWLHAATTGKVA